MDTTECFMHRHELVERIVKATTHRTRSQTVQIVTSWMSIDDLKQVAEQQERVKSCQTRR